MPYLEQQALYNSINFSLNIYRASHSRPSTGSASAH